MKKDLFTAQEINVLKLIWRESTSIEIADKLNLSTKRIEQIRSDLLIKTKAKNIIGVMKFGVKNKIIS